MKRFIGKIYVVLKRKIRNFDNFIKRYVDHDCFFTINMTENKLDDKSLSKSR